MSETPFLQVIRGDATPEEIAALVALLSARAATGAASAAPVRSAWAAPARLVRPAVRPGPGGWRGSAFPV